MCRRPLLVLFSSLLFLGCTQDTPMDKGLCHSVSGTISDSRYVLGDFNFSCDTVDAIHVPFDIDKGSFSAASLAPADVLADLNEAADAWSSVVWNGENVQLKVDIGDTLLGTTDHPPAQINENYGSEVESHIYMDPGSKDAAVDDIDSIATSYLWGASESLQPIATNCDIVVWAKRSGGTSYNFVANDVASPGEYDLAYILAHELGHCVGILDQKHDDLFADLMYHEYTAGTDFTGLPDHEREAAHFLYGIVE